MKFPYVDDVLQIQSVFHVDSMSSHRFFGIEMETMLIQPVFAKCAASIFAFNHQTTLAFTANLPDNQGLP